MRPGLFCQVPYDPYGAFVAAYEDMFHCFDCVAFPACLLVIWVVDVCPVISDFRCVVHHLEEELPDL